MKVAIFGRPPFPSDSGKTLAGWTASVYGDRTEKRDLFHSDMVMSHGSNRGLLEDICTERAKYLTCSRNRVEAAANAQVTPLPDLLAWPLGDDVAAPGAGPILTVQAPDGRPEHHIDWSAVPSGRQLHCAEFHARVLPTTHRDGKAAARQLFFDCQRWRGLNPSRQQAQCPRSQP